MAPLVISGEVFTVECPHCNTASQLDYELVYRDLLKDAMIMVISKDSPDYIDAINDVRSSDVSSCRFQRVVEDIESLKEKVACLELGRDDRVIELCKAYVVSDVKVADADFKAYAARYTVQDGAEYLCLFGEGDGYRFVPLSEDTYSYVKELYYSSTHDDSFDLNYSIVDYAWAEGMLMQLMKEEALAAAAARAKAKAEAEAKAKAEAESKAKAEAEAKAKAKAEAEAKAKAEAEAKPETKPVAKPETKPVEVRDSSADGGDSCCPVCGSVLNGHIAYCHGCKCHRAFIYDYGLMPNMPIMVNSEDELKSYLHGLYTQNGESLLWSRIRTVEGMKGDVYEYKAYRISSSPYNTIYVSTNGRGTLPLVVPAGFSTHRAAAEHSSQTPQPKTDSVPYVLPPKKKKRGLFLKIFLAIIIIGIINNVIRSCGPSQKYNEACDDLSSGNYAEAVTKFDDLGSYKDSKTKKLDAMYYYVRNNQNNDDYLTYDYLTVLIEKNYGRNVSNIYSELYDWKMEIAAINGDADDKETYLGTISKYSPIYFHFNITGGKPDGVLYMTARIIFPNGSDGNHTFTHGYYDGDYAWFGYENGLYGDDAYYGDTGVLACAFYDDTGKKLGEASVYVEW